MTPEQKARRDEAVAMRKRVRAELREQTKMLRARMKHARRETAKYVAKALYVPGLPLPRTKAKRAALIIGLRDGTADLAVNYYRRSLSPEEKRRTLKKTRTRKSR